MRERKLELLECPYHQLVFTLPPMFSMLVRENPALLYKLLLDCVRDVLDELARDPKHLGGIPQFLLALHTWNGALDYHVHVHALMAAGAYEVETKRWIPSPHRRYLFPVKVLSALFRGKFVSGLRGLEAAGRLSMTWPDNTVLGTAAGWSIFVEQAYRTPFFTYVDKTAKGPDNAIEYLGHYLYRTGLSNSRLVSLEDGQVTYRCKDRKKRFSTSGAYTRTMPVTAFVNLFAKHILPKGFHRIRFAGLWSQACKRLHLQDAKEAVLRHRGQRAVPRLVPPPRPQPVCPACREGVLVLGCTVIPTSATTRRMIAHRPRGPPKDRPSAEASFP